MAKPRNNQTIYDWDTIHAEYRTGTFSDAELARRHGCSRTAIQKRVKKEVWSRDLAAAVKAKVNEKLINEDARVARGVAARNGKDRTVDIEAASKFRTNIRLSHRKDIANLRKLEKGLIDELQSDPKKFYMAQYQGKIIKKEVGLTASEKSMAANNLANVQHKRIQLECQAFSLDSTSGDDDAPNRIKVTFYRDSA